MFGCEVVRGSRSMIMIYVKANASLLVLQQMSFCEILLMKFIYYSYHQKKKKKKHIEVDLHMQLCPERERENYLEADLLDKVVTTF